MNRHNSSSKPKKIGGDNIQVSIGDNAHGVVVGKNVRQNASSRTYSQVTEDDRILLRELFINLKKLVEEQASPKKKDSAIALIKELEDTITSKKPDLTRIDRIKQWFGKHLPKFANAVVSVLVNPIVGKVAEATGELASGELKRHFERDAKSN